MADLTRALRETIVDVPDYPKPGILFRDLSPVYQKPAVLASMTEFGAQQAREWKAAAVAGIESRGFVVGSTISLAASLPFVMFRKKDKLPRKRIGEKYSLEYGDAVMEAHVDSFGKGDRVMIMDDLLATGGTAEAATKLVVRLGATVAGYLFIVELGALKGRARLAGAPVVSMLIY